MTSPKTSPVASPDGASPISPETEKRIALLFPPDEHARVRKILSEHCGRNLPLTTNASETTFERIQFAALKLSEGDLNKLDRAVALAKRDWRDLLMAAGFAHQIEAHKAWWPERRG